MTATSWLWVLLGINTAIYAYAASPTTRLIRVRRLKARCRMLS